MEPLHVDLSVLEKSNEVYNAVEHVESVLGETASAVTIATKHISGFVFTGYFNVAKGLVVSAVTMPLWLRSERFAGEEIIKHWRECKWSIDGNSLTLLHDYASDYNNEQAISEEWENGMEELVYACTRYGVTSSLDKYDFVNLLKYKGHKVLTDWMLKNNIEEAKKKAERKAIKKILNILKGIN